MNTLDRDPQSYLDGAIMAYQDCADFIKGMAKRCPHDALKPALMELAKGLQAKASLAQHITNQAKVNETGVA